ncbi:PadR family transcriptional regulator [Alloiococcus sp. CFN-8]|uniref:PadR family transcriptional regulator n=1 Tax=Alloiococcus sp. CFN-8 TaxID=3416081 RepID=UPI003CF45C37
MYIDILILSQLIHGPKHGYKIKKNVAFVLGESYKLNNNTLYPRLKKFEEMGAVVKEVEIQEGSPNRFLYSITDKGKEIFQRLLQDVNEDTGANNNEFHNKLAFFSLLTEENREKLLTSRIKYLEKQLDFMDKMIQVVREEDYMPFSKQLYIYTKGMLTNEIMLVKSLRTFESE